MSDKPVPPSFVQIEAKPGLKVYTGTRHRVIWPTVYALDGSGNIWQQGEDDVFRPVKLEYINET